jgi:hypothetical protein
VGKSIFIKRRKSNEQRSKHKKGSEEGTAKNQEGKKGG